MFNSLSQLRKFNYCKVSHYALPAKPSNNPEFVYIGRKPVGRPFLLEEYIRGGYRFSEKRRMEIKENFKNVSPLGRKSLYPNCFKLSEALFGKDLTIYYDDI